MTLKDADFARYAMQYVPRIGPAKLRTTFGFTPGSPHDVADHFRQHGLVISDASLEFAIDQAYRDVDTCNDLRIQIIPLGDSRYPKQLKSISDPPPFLFVKGSLPEKWGDALAVIGTREPHQFAMEATKSLVQAAAAMEEVVIVSGLALGIDSVAHQSALDHHLSTVAVLANGLDGVYPQANRRLSEDIIDAGGALLSENPPGRRAERFALVARDRLQSGLARAVYVMQSALDGGSMHTALFSKKQSRKLYALTPPEASAEWSGNAFLIGTSQRPTPQTEAFSKYFRAGPIATAMSTVDISECLGIGIATHFVSDPELRFNFE